MNLLVKVVVYKTVRTNGELREAVFVHNLTESFKVFCQLFFINKHWPIV